MDARSRTLLSRWNAPVPRYTSYPTAPHFGDEVGPDLYARWLAGADPSAKVSAYIHVPFCDTLCWFCACNTRAVRRRATLEAYVDDLCAEIGRVGALSQARRVERIHWGGGSPTVLEPQDIARINAALRAAFDVSDDAEFAVEIDPRDITPEKLDAFVAAGLNRASLGLQDADPEVQTAINRIQPMDETAALVDALRARGVRSLNVDLVYGLPKQSLERFAATLEAVIALKPDRLAVFGYAHVPHFAPRQQVINALDLPSPEARFEQALFAQRRMVQAGYVPIGMDHFASPGDGLARAADEGRLARNFQGYVDDPADMLLGFGASAISALGPGYAQAITDVATWSRTVRAGELPIAKGVVLTRDDRLRRHVIEELMCAFEVDLAAAAHAFDEPLAAFDEDLERLRPALADGLCELAGSVVRVTADGRPFVRAVAAAFDARMQAKAARHAMAV